MCGCLQVSSGRSPLSCARLPPALPRGGHGTSAGRLHRSQPYREQQRLLAPPCLAGTGSAGEGEVWVWEKMPISLHQVRVQAPLPPPPSFFFHAFSGPPVSPCLTPSVCSSPSSCCYRYSVTGQGRARKHLFPT